MEFRARSGPHARAPTNTRAPGALEAATPHLPARRGFGTTAAGPALGARHFWGWLDPWSWRELLAPLVFGRMHLENGRHEFGPLLYFIYIFIHLAG